MVFFRGKFLGFIVALEPQDALLINFHRYYRKTTSGKIYYNIDFDYENTLVCPD